MSDANTIRHARCGQLMLLAHGMNPPSAEEWSEYVAALDEASRSGVTGLLVLTDGPGPNSSQRKMVSGVDLRSAVLTPSQVARGMVTALSWFGLKIRAFTPEQVDDALTFLDVSVADQPEALQQLASMRLELAGKNPSILDALPPRRVHEIVTSSLETLASL